MSDYTQLKTPNLSVVGQPEMCLAYVRAVFGATGEYPTATSGWENAAYQHAGEQPPTDVSVPVWFSYNGPDGHVAVSVPGKGIYSTSAVGDKIFPSIQALISWMGEGFKYLGWSEDVDKERVCEPATTPVEPPSWLDLLLGSNINLPPTSGAWHLYKQGGPYNPNNPSDYIAVVHPALYAPEGITYPILAELGNGVYRVKSPSHGVGDLWTNGSSFTVS
jgi:hypothetical protein